eukprot:TRINITY_DN11896_c0_g1_i2.p1 TRINITY_DN11896_c0_g1~~TRINITY_DN11896_c0_g1_i2.p1  ORF type:complete len:452 (-),score=69.01 TRINITY_DN11896_c0_g1_i2:423-1778(-)
MTEANLKRFEQMLARIKSEQEVSDQNTEKFDFDAWDMGKSNNRNKSLNHRATLIQNEIREMKKARKSQCLTYMKTNQIDASTDLVDGFMDIMGYSGNGLPNDQALRYMEGLSVLSIDKGDKSLHDMVNTAVNLCKSIPDIELKSKILASYIVANMGGAMRNPSETINLHMLSESTIESLHEVHGNIIQLGSINFGLSRSRSLLFKYMADKVNIPCSLNRNTMHKPCFAWNNIIVHNKSMIVDLLHNPTALYPTDSNEGKEYLDNGNTLSLNDYTCNMLYSNHNHNTNNVRRFNSFDFQSDVTVINSLGKGRFGDVYSVKLDGLNCAMKIIKKANYNRGDLTPLLTEIKVFESLNHPNIVKFIGKEDGPENLTLYLELMHGALNEFKEIIEFKDIKFICTNILHGLEYIHNLPKSVIHRDIKATNILVDCSEDRIASVKIGYTIVYMNYIYI